MTARWRAAQPAWVSVLLTLQIHELSGVKVGELKFEKYGFVVWGLNEQGKEWHDPLFRWIKIWRESHTTSNRSFTVRAGWYPQEYRDWQNSSSITLRLKKVNKKLNEWTIEHDRFSFGVMVVGFQVWEMIKDQGLKKIILKRSGFEKIKLKRVLAYKEAVPAYSIEWCSLPDIITFCFWL